MEKKSIFNFITRGLLQICASIVRQLPQSWGVQINTALFLSSFTMKDGNVVMEPEPWKEAPDGVVADPDVNDNADPINAAVIRKKHHIEWVNYQAQMASLIPSQWGWIKKYDDRTCEGGEAAKPRGTSILGNKSQTTYKFNYRNCVRQEQSQHKSQGQTT